MSMKLSDFVRDAITEIAFGIHQAKAETYQIIAVVPGTLNGQSLEEKSYIEFDVAVTASSETGSQSDSGGKAGIGISVVGFRAGMDGSTSSTETEKSMSSTISRINFKVPVYFNAHFRGDAGAATEAEFVQELAERR